MATYIHIGPESRQLLDRLNQVVEAYKSKTAQPFQEQFHEFGDCRYLILVDVDEHGSATCQLSFALPELAAAFRQQLYNAQSLSLIQDAFKGVAELAQPPLKGYQVHGRPTILNCACEVRASDGMRGTHLRLH